MKKLIMGLVAALIATTTPALATEYVFENWRTGVTISCSVNTTFEQDQYWVNFLNLSNSDTYNSAITYHQAQNSAQSTAAVCWLQAINSLSSEDFETRYINGIGFIPTGMPTDDVARVLYYISTDFSNIDKVPSDFLDILDSAEHNDFMKGWETANGIGGRFSTYESSNATNADDHLSNWIEAWEASDKSASTAVEFAADISEYFY